MNLRFQALHSVPLLWDFTIEERLSFISTITRNTYGVFVAK